MAATFCFHLKDALKIINFTQTAPSIVVILKQIADKITSALPTRTRRCLKQCKLTHTVALIFLVKIADLIY